MSLLDDHSCECLKSELDLFRLPPTQTSIEDSFYVKYYPLTSLDRSGPIEFKIHAGEYYIDPQSIILYTKTRILDEDGDELDEKTSDTDETIPDKSYVFPINYFHASKFKNVEVYMQNKLISSNDNMYAYKAYLEALLSYNCLTKQEQLQAGGFYKDTDNTDEVSKIKAESGTTSNTWVISRFAMTSFSSPFETWGKIHSPIFTQEKFIPSNIELRIRFIRADQNFCLMAKNGTERYFY